MNAHRYDRFTVLLHWSMAILIAAQIALGFWMVDLPKDDSGIRASRFNLHKSIGMVLLILAVLRSIWLALRPAMAATATGWMDRSARIAHGALYVLMVLVPLSGFLGSAFSKYPIRFFGFPLPRIADPWNAAKDLCSDVHQLSSYALTAMVVVHLMAFAYHQFVLKDRLILRMR
ncbi:MAG: cytochrome b [Burkholderiales bacterium]|nr:cytochrome b [Burkholderiales bacterium]